MKKIFSLVFAVALTTGLWATTYYPTPATDTIKSIFDKGLADGDTIVLTNGTYYEWKSMTFTTKITFIAAPGTKPVLHWYSINMNNDFEVNGIEMVNISTNNYLLRTSASNSQNILIKNCSFALNANVATPVAYIYLSSKTIGKLEIDNCIFKDNAVSEQAVLYAGSATIGNFKMTNSTVMNCNGSKAVRMKDGTTALVDHCTFYNCGEKAICIGTDKCTTTIAAKNIVIANPSLVTEEGAFFIYNNGTFDNSVYYNRSNAANWMATKTNVVNADPQFVDAANGNLNFALTSPLFLAANDGKHIGDPRWGVEAGEAIAVPDTLAATDAVLAGSKISASENGIAWNDNTANPADNTASWAIDVAKAGNYDIVIYEASISGHNFIVSIADKDAWLDTIVESNDTKWNHNCDLKIGTLNFPKAGKYIIRLTNGTKNSSAIAKYFIVNYAGGGVVEIPAVLPNEEAMLNGPKIKKTADGIAWNDNEQINQDFAEWNVNVAKAGDYVVKMTVSKAVSSGHKFFVNVYDKDGQMVGDSIKEGSNGEITLAAGTYTIHLGNNTPYSSAVMESVSIFYKGGGVMAIPGQLPGEEALLTGAIIRLENGSVKWPDKKDIVSNYVTWNVTAAEEADVDIYAYIGTPSSGHCFTAALYDGETLMSSVSEAETVHTTGEVKLGTISVEDAGTYTIRLTNATEHSSTIVDSLVVKVAEGPIEITLDETDTENADLTTYLDKTVNVNLVRSMPTGMFSTICLPFGASKSGQFVGAKIYYLDSTYIKGEDEVILCFKENTDFYQGIPYIIEPATAVNNPRFENVVIKKPTAGKTEKDHAIFQGTYFKKHLEAGNENLLFLGQNNTLYFPNENDTESMKGLRAYFEIKQAPGAPIRRASIKMGTDVVTTLDLVDGQAIPNGKFMLNGQIIIRANGQDYMLNGMQK